MLDLISFQSSLDPSQLLRKKIEACIAAMESAAGMPLAKMPRQEILKYQETLSELLSSRVQSTVSQEKVVELLELIGQPD
jgi:hypothetical protein